MFRRVLLFLVIPAALVDLMHLTGIGPDWPSDLLNRGWMLSSLAVMLSGILLISRYRPVSLWRIFSGLFFLLYALFVLTTVLSVNRAAGIAANEKQIGDAVGDYYNKSVKTNMKSGVR